jgi:hypothetical protein
MKSSIDRESLTIAMSVVPGLYSRNKFFGFYRDPEVRRARSRAALIRGIVRQLSGAQGTVERVVLSRGEGGSELRYAIPCVRLERRVELGDLEASCVAYLATRAGVVGLHVTEDDRAKVDGALRRLAIGLRLSSVESGASDATSSST